jgi:hypothetical protein
METPEKKNNVSDFFRMLNLEGEEIWADIENSALVTHFRETAKMSMFWWAVMIIISAVIIMVSYVEYRNNPGAAEPSSTYSVIYTIIVAVMALCTYTITIATARVSSYAGAAIAFEGAAIGLLTIIYNMASAVIPDRLERAFDQGKHIEKMLEKAKEQGNVGEFATSVFKSHAHITALALFTPWILLNLPLVVFAHPTLVFLSMIGIAILVYQVVGFDTEAYWYPLVQQFMMYSTAIPIILWMVAFPIVRASGVFQGWGPVEAGYYRTGFWFAIFVIAFVIGFSGSGVVRIAEGKNKGKTTFQIGSAARVFASVVIIVAACLFGSAIITKASGLGTGQGPSVIDQIVGNNNSGGGTANGNEINTGNGPYVKNTDPKLQR